MNDHDDLMDVVDGLLFEAGLNRRDLGGAVTFAGMDPIRPTHIKVGSAAAAITAANSIASAIIWKQRTGESQDIHVDLRKAYVTQSAWQDTLVECTLVNGTQQMRGGNVGQLGSHILPTRDGRFVVLTSLYSSNTKRIMELLDSGVLPRQLEQATRKWDAQDLERAAQNAGVALAICRTREEYEATQQFQHHIGTPLIHIEKIGESPPEPFIPGDRPLSGVRALGMVHVVAGPAVMRQLSAQGADALNLNTLDWVEEPTIFWQCLAGIRETYLDARVDANRKPIYELVKESDVFVENMRPGLVASQGFSAETLARYRPGIIYVSGRLNTPKGPWADWMGYDFTAAGLTGMFTDIGSADQPQLPHGVNVVCDFLTGYLGAIGVQAALLRRAAEGGSYKVTVTLSQTLMFEQALGLVDDDTLLRMDELGPEHRPLKPNLQTGQTAFGEFTRLGSQVEMSRTPEYWADPIISPIGSSKPEWLPR
ncbi:CoA transferase [Streptomyces griseoluteus]|uniref:CoA transferase n=1 Tax=Streptomyces griseoluteus TaxID=29306 RepID=UPI0037FB600A